MDGAAVLRRRVGVIADRKEAGIDHVEHGVNQRRFLPAIALGANGDASIQLALQVAMQILIRAQHLDEALRERTAVAEINRRREENGVGAAQRGLERVEVDGLAACRKMVGQRNVIDVGALLARAPQRRDQGNFAVRQPALAA